MSDIGKIQHREISEEMRESYLDYAMSVIVSRALPDARDGLKPVHRRILYAMHELGLRPGVKFVKSARVVGEVLGKFHPHGDLAVYDALVRLAQPFSLRYPLVAGQGNFGCFTKDTKVKLTDGREINFEQLMAEAGQGKKNYTYTVNSMGLIAIAEIKNPRFTRQNAALVKVTLDNGEEIRCTPNHLFMRRDGTYQEARALTPGDALMPLYARTSEKMDRINREGYALIYQHKNDEWVPLHHLADNYNLTQRRYKKSAGRVRHHIDFNKQNNNPENITRIGWGAHWRIHYEHASNQHKNSEYREKIAAGRNRYWAYAPHREKKAREVAARNRSNWQIPEYREKMRRFLSEVNKNYIHEHPERRKEFSERATRTLKRLWQDPTYRTLFHEKIVRANKNRVTNKTGKTKFLHICREALAQFSLIDKETYERARKRTYPYGAAPLWETGVRKYFQNNPELVRQAVSKNHKVVKVETLEAREDVYDLTIEGTHNFSLAAGIFVHNSVDGDSPAAQRYTEAKLAPIAEELLGDIEKSTVDFRPNYDGTRQEPSVLPALLPNLLVNGSMGIAVGMATNIPPHNLGEVVDALQHLLKNPNASSEDLANFVQGPDFPTGGIIYGRKTIVETYATGKGGILVRGKAEIEERAKAGREGGLAIAISEIPYEVNKAELIAKIAEFVETKRLEGIRDIRDESDREGLRIVIDLKAEANPRLLLNQLYRFTELEKTFHVNMLALVDGIQPQVLSLREMLGNYLEHRKVVVTRRTKHDLEKAEERAHILRGLAKALEHIDEVVKTIKSSENRQAAAAALMKKFALSDRQANAILEMRLESLAKLERKKILVELEEKAKLAKELAAILKDPKKILGVIASELEALKKKYGDARRTRVHAAPLEEVSEEELVPKEEIIVAISQSNYVKRMVPDAFRLQRRGGKGVIGFEAKATDDALKLVMAANSHDMLLFFSNRGRVFPLRAYEITAGSRVSRGKPIQNFLSLLQDEEVTAMVAYSPKDSAEGYLMLATKNGILKKTPLKEFGRVRKSGMVAITLKRNDALRWAELSSGKDEVIMVSAAGQAIRFPEAQVRSMGRASAGVAGMRLRKNDELVGMGVVGKITHNTPHTTRLLVVTKNGFGKQTPISSYRLQRRGGVGIKTGKVNEKTGPIIAAEPIREETEFIAASEKGQTIRTALAAIPVHGRAAQGVKVMKLEAGDAIAAITTI